MSSSAIERYEEFIREHPDALAFVEHAKALLEDHAFEQAIEVCREGVEKHPKSIVGRVLWGKALVRLGKPADAMHEFEAAIALDRENPRAYGLVAEVFLETRLFRSALPMLRKACSLEPENPNFKLYLEYTQKALAGESLPEFISLLNWTEFEEIPQRVAADVDADGPTQSFPPDSDEDGPTQSFAVEQAEEEPGREKEEVEEVEVEEVVEKKTQPQPAQRWQDNGRGGWVARIPVAKQEPKETVQAAKAPQQKAQQPPKSATLAMLETLPDLPQEQKAPAVSAAAQAHVAEREGQAYESKLKAELEAREKRKTFWKKWGTGYRGAAVLAVVVGAVAGTGGYIAYHLTGKKQARITNHLVEARRSINLDMQASYELALKSLKSALELDGANTEAWSLKALVHARRFQAFGAAVGEREAAIKAIEEDSVRKDYPKVALLVDAMVGSSAVREKARQDILASKDLPSDIQNPDSQSLDIQSSDIQSEAGWLLLAEGKPENALKRFNDAAKLFAPNVRAWIGLAETYLALGEEDNAYKALNASTLPDGAREHPLRILGLARARLALDKEMDISLREMKTLTAETGLPNDRKMQRERVYGLLLSALGDEKEAVAVLERGKQLFSEHVFEFGLDLGDVYLRSGQVLSAQKQFEEAIQQRMDSLEAKEKLAKVLVAREKVDDILTKIPPDSNELIFARAWALMQQGDWKKLRTELEKTQVRRKYESRAIAFLAMADAAENNVPKARSNLETALKNLQGSREKAPLQFALANILMSTAPDKAKELLREAVGEPSAEEAACVLAKLLMEEGNFEQAKTELQKALKRNGSLMCSRNLSIAVLGDLGQFDEAYAEASQWVEDDAQSIAALQAFSLAAIRSTGRLNRAEITQEALKAADKALALDKNNVRSLRLKAEALFVLGRLGEAMNFLRQANKRDPSDADVFCSSGMGFFRENNIDTAQLIFLSALENNAKSICGTVGLWLTQPFSSKWLTELSAKAPEIKPAWERSMALAALANAQLKAGSVALANQTAEKALLAAPSSAIAQWIVGKAAAQDKREKEAMVALRRAIQLEPAWAEPHLLLADILAKNPDTLGQALTSYQNFLNYNKDENARKLANKKLQALRQ